jgi:hypothetical protein
MMLPTACVGLFTRPRSRQFRLVSRLVRSRSVAPCPVVVGVYLLPLIGASGLYPV